MDEFALEDTLRINERDFSVKTTTDLENNQALSSVFESDTLVFNQSTSIFVRKKSTARVDPEYLHKRASEIHNDVKEQFEVLFFIYDRIQTNKSPQAHFRLGNVFLSKNLLDEAVQSYQNAIRLQNDYVKAYRGLGACYLKMDRPQDAVDILHAALGMNPEYPDLLDELGVAHTFGQQFEKARNQFQKALSIKDDFVEAELNLGILLFLSAIDSHDEKAIVPARLKRSLKKLQELEQYKDSYWQAPIEQTKQIFEAGTITEIRTALHRLQLQLIGKGDFNPITDYFYLKFMFGGRELSDKEIDFYVRKIQEEVGKHEAYADYWNERGVLHLIQCRNYFLKAISEFQKSLNINPKYEEPKQSLELLKRGQKGFLILLRAILK